MRRRYEREIEELLAQMEEFLPEEPPPRRCTRITRWLGDFWKSVSSWWRRLPAQQLMLASFLLAAIAFFLRFLTPTLAYLTGIGAAFLFVFAWALSFWQGRAPLEKRWRGKVIELPRRGNWLGRWFDHWTRRKAR